jgi:hypothetical protein
VECQELEIDFFDSPPTKTASFIAIEQIHKSFSHTGLCSELIVPMQIDAAITFLKPNGALESSWSFA